MKQLFARARLGLLALTLALLVPASVQAATPAVGAKASQVDLRSVPGAVSFEGKKAIPLKAERPAWFTPELAAKVDAANGVPVALPNDAPLPGEVGIRPGSWILSPAGCTTNFVFTSGSQLAIGTAGHCANVGDEVVLVTLAPGGANPVLVEVGTVSISHNNGVGDDFALIPIRPELYSWVSPTAAVVAGPCGAYGGAGPETVAHYGHGVGIGTGGTPRAGVALSWKQDAFGWDGAAIFGDSGSAVRVTNLAAAGDLTHLVVDTNWVPSFIVGTRISKIEQINGSWSLANSPLCL